MAIRIPGWIGFVAGLFGFLLMGALPGVAMAAAHPQQASVSSDAHTHVHGSAAHAHNHGGATKDVAQHSHGPVQSDGSDPCKDRCCGASCHVLPGPVVGFTQWLAAPADKLTIAHDRVAGCGECGRIDRPPRG